uniref:Enoyl reductase n=1 Tax=Streptoalloteichus sp. ATCC 53650 TaxID=756733 RepID=K4P166_9PSEU|nr:enoyl reductase [Streptoalloteichus sp. ATCC 53650]
MSVLESGSLAALLTPAHHALRERARDFFTDARLAGWREPANGPLTGRAWRELGEAGYLGVSLPTEFGGAGLGVLGSLVLGEAVSRLGDVGLPLGMHVQNEVACQWLVDADPVLRAEFLPRLLDGRLVACQADTDPSADEPTTAVRDGDDLVVNGAKLFVINGAVAGLCFTRVLLDGSPAIVAVDKDRPGVRVAEVYDKLGTRSADSARLEFTDVRVPATRVVSSGGVGRHLRWNRVMTLLRFLIAADAALVHRRLLDRVTRYAGERALGGRPLAAWPVNSHALARFRADLELVEAGVARACARLDAGAWPVPEVAALKWFCVERACALAAACCDLEGGAGYMWGNPSLRDLAQLRGLRMAGGSQTTMLTITNHSFAARAEWDTAGVAR